jgi:hypothetical protein
VLSRGSTSRGTIDLRSKIGAYIFPKIGRGGATALTNGVNVLIRRVLNNDTAQVGGVHPVGINLLSIATAANLNTTVDADSNSGQAVLNVASTTTVVAGDIICIQDSGGGVTRLEWHRVSKVSAGVSVTLDRNLQYTHTGAQADTVRNKADVFSPVWVDGGSLVEVIFDYGDDSAGESVTVQALAQSWDS